MTGRTGGSVVACGAALDDEAEVAVDEGHVSWLVWLERFSLVIDCRKTWSKSSVRSLVMAGVAAERVFESVEGVGGDWPCRPSPRISEREPIAACGVRKGRFIV